jgi:phage terminase Nu1 subunit (DNA packaging protein)
MTPNDSGIASLIAKAEQAYGLILTARAARRLVGASPATFARAIRSGELPVLGRRGRRGQRLFETGAVIRWIADSAKARH